MSPAAPMAPPARERAGGAGRTARRLAITAFFAYAITGGGRIVGSDEVTMLEVARAMLRGTVAVPEGATMRGPDGRSYSKNAAGQAVLALPLVAAATVAARGLDPGRRELAVRFVVSFFDAIVTAVLLGVFYAGIRAVGVGRGGAMAAALMLGFATPLWVYSKSFMAEPLQGLGLSMAMLGASLAAGVPRPALRSAPWLAALGVLLAVSAKLSMLPLALACLVPMAADPPATWRAPLAGLGIALLGHALYDQARFATPFETGYGLQATAAAYSTPLLVGLYGLLISSGKGVMWFAPPLWLVPRGMSVMASNARAGAPGIRSRLGLDRAPGRAAWSAAAGAAVALFLYGRFQHWAGDGSFGPRYLIPVLPLLFTAVAFAVDSQTSRAGGEASERGARDLGASRAVRLAALVLAVAGFLVQIGGVAIYFGAQMREAGDYPYTLPLDDPRFMGDSHFNPRFSPIAGHWRMLARNVREHLAGRAPRIGSAARAGDTGALAGTEMRAAPVPTTRDAAAVRLGIGAAEQRALLRALDFWWLYLGYAGLPRAPVWGAFAVLVTLLVVGALRTRVAWRAEADGR